MTRLSQLFLLFVLAGCQSPTPSAPVTQVSPSPSAVASVARTVLPGDRRVTRDYKPPLKEWAKLSPQCGLTLAPDGLYYTLPNVIQALRWDAIDKITLYETTLHIEVEPADPIKTLPGMSLDSATQDYWTPRLPTASLVKELVGYAGLSPDPDSGGDGFKRTTGKPSPPQKPRFIPLLKEAPPNIGLPPSKLARLQPGLGLFVDKDGVTLAEPTQVSSITWKKLGHVDDRYSAEAGDAIVYLGLREDAVPGDYEAICFQGPDKDTAIFLSGPDYLEAVPLIQKRKGPARPQYYPLRTGLTKLGEASVTELPGDALVPIKAPASTNSWPGQALAGVHPLASGVYLLPTGLYRVKPNIVEYAAWNEITFASFDLQGNAVLYASENINLEEHDLKQIPQMRALSQTLLDILRFGPDSDQPGTYRPAGAQPQPPASGLFSPLGTGKWDWPPFEDLGQEPWRTGLHLQRDALVWCAPNYLEVYLWENLGGYEIERDDELWLRDNRGHGQRFPSTVGRAPKAVLESAWKLLPAYWKATGRGMNGEIEGQALPRHQRPAQLQHIEQQTSPDLTRGQSSMDEPSYLSM